MGKLLWLAEFQALPDRSRVHLHRGRVVRTLRFTTAEEIVLRLVATGATNDGIAFELGIKSTTVKAHIGSLMRKSSMANRVQLTLFYLASLSKADRDKHLTDTKRAIDEAVSCARCARRSRSSAPSPPP